MNNFLIFTITEEEDGMWCVVLCCLVLSEVYCLFYQLDY